jgi:hypothetical protein
LTRLMHRPWFPLVLYGVLTVAAGARRPQVLCRRFGEPQPNQKNPIKRADTYHPCPAAALRLPRRSSTLCYARPCRSQSWTCVRRS